MSEALKIDDQSKEWIAIGELSQIPQLGARVVETEGGNIAVFRCQDDALFALRDRCPHRGGPLSQGIVFDRKVACPLHDWVIGLEDGQAVAPDKGCVERFEVCHKGGVVYLKLRG